MTDLSDFVLEVNQLHLGFGNDEVLYIDSLSIPNSCVIGLLGPSSSGKSTLFSALIGGNNNPAYWQQGEVRLNGALVEKGVVTNGIGVVLQKARLYTGTILENLIDGLPLGKLASIKQQKAIAKKVFSPLGLWSEFELILEQAANDQSMGFHKMLLIAKEMAKKPRLLLLDEVLAGTSVADEKIIIQLINKLKTITTVLVITHNKIEAESYSDYIALISGGILHEFTESKLFFTEPKSKLGCEYLLNGSAWYQNTSVTKHKKTAKAAALRKFSSVNEFFWVLSDLLGGMQRPGLLTEINDDLAVMTKLHVHHLVSLTTQPVDRGLLAEYDIVSHHFPIIDMSIPELEPTVLLMKNIKTLLDKKQSVVFHCKAGMGRTGIMLACALVYCNDMSAIGAIEKIRKTNHKYIQTDEQYGFIDHFARFVQ